MLRENLISVNEQGYSAVPLRAEERERMAIPVTATLTAFCGLLMVGLATRISMLRMRHKVAFGDGGNTELMRAIRVHANTAEHAPIFILLALAYELTAGSTFLLIVMATLFAAARIGFTVALLGRGLHRLRMAGALFTYASQFVLGSALALALA
jgi:uncharacterized protein